VASRAETLHALLQSVDNNVDARSAALGGEIIAALKHKGGAFNIFYPTIAGNLFDVASDRLVPPLPDLPEAMRRIEQAKSPTEFSEALAQYKSGREGLVGYPIDSMKLPKFFAIADPTTKVDQPGNMLAPWNRHVKWAIERLNQGDSDAAAALLTMGVEDPRLYKAIVSRPDFWQSPFPKMRVFASARDLPIARNNKFSTAQERILSEFEYVESADNLFLKYPANPAKRWDRNSSIVALKSSINFNLASDSSSVVQAPREPFTSVANFNDWLATQMPHLQAPALLRDASPSLRQLHSNLQLWYGEDKAFKARTLASPYITARYPQEFVQWFHSEMAPLHRSTESLVSLFNAQLQQDPEIGRTIIREFYLNPPSQPGLKQMLGDGVVPTFLPSENPIFNFVVEHSHLFSIKEKIAIFGLHTAPPTKSEWYEKVLGVASAHNLKDMALFIERMDEYRREFSESRENTLNRVYEENIEKAYIVRSRSADAVDFYHEIGKRLSSILRDDVNQGALENFLAKPLPELMRDVFKDTPALIDMMRGHVASISDVKSDVIQHAQIYKNIDSYSLFPSYESQRQFSETLLKRIQASTNPLVRVEAAQALMSGRQIADAALRMEIATIWTKGIQEMMHHHAPSGLDNGTADYLSKVMPHIAWAEANVAVSDRYRLFVDLADQLESQRDLSYRLRDSFQLNREAILSTDESVRIGEAIISHSSQSPESRQALLDYLVRPASPESTDKFSKHLKKMAEESRSGTSSGALGEYFLGETSSDFYLQTVKNLHENFTVAPLPLRIAVLDQLLMASEEKDYATSHDEGVGEDAVAKKALQRSLTYACDMLLPEGMKYAPEARKALEAYTKKLPPNERGLFLSAMLAANDAAVQTGNTMSVGERLAIMLEMMGPAEVKAGRALSNFPDAPMDIREPMVRLTKKAAPSPRWALWQRYDDVIPDVIKATVHRIGEVMGNGTYQEGVRLEKNNGDSSILKLQRPSIERRADAGFDQLRLFVEELRSSEALERNAVEATDRIIKQAQEMAARETDAEYRLAQVKQAQGYYNPLSITVDGHTFKFQTADWLAYGVDRAEIAHRIDRKEWCEEREMRGVHLDELSMQTPADKAYAKALAKAVVTAEMYVLLSGQPIDNDRHPAQGRIDRATDTIGLFDHGALDLTPPTKAEKQLLAKLFVAATQGYQEGASMPQLFYEQLKETKETLGHVPDYLVKVERGVLAMSRFFKHLDTTDLKEIVAAVHQSGAIDQDILDTKIKVKLPMLGEQAIKLSTALDRTLPKSSSIQLAIAPNTAIPEPVRYDYVAKTELEHPKFPGVSQAPRSHAAGGGTTNAVNPARTLQVSTALMGTTAFNDGPIVSPHMPGSLAEAPSLTPVAQVFEHMQAQALVVPDSARLAVNDQAPARPTNLASATTTLKVGDAANEANLGPATPDKKSSSTHAMATQRNAIQSGAGNGVGVAMGAYGLWSKFNDKDGTFHDDLRSGDTVRQTAALVGLGLDVTDIGLSGFSVGVDARTFQQAKAQAASVPVAITPAQVAAPSAPVASAATTTPSATTGSSGAPAQPSSPAAQTSASPATAKLSAPGAPAAHAAGSATATTASSAPAATPAAPTTPASPNASGQSTSSSTPTVKPAAPATPAAGSVQAPQAPAAPVSAQAGAGRSTASTATAQAEKAAAEAISKAAEQAEKTAKLLKAGKLAGRGALVVTVGIGIADGTAGAKAGDRERVAGAAGGTLGAIAVGAAAGALAAGAAGALFGSVVPGWGTVAVGLVAGLGGGIYGAVVGEEKAKEHLSGLAGRMIGSDDKFLEAMKQLDAATQKQFAGKDGKLTLDDVHKVLKDGKLGSVAHVDTDKDGKLTGSELKAALEKARTTFIDNQLTDQLTALEAKGWGKNLGNKDGKVTLDELKTSLKEKGIALASLDKDNSGTISGKEITDAIAAAQASTTQVAQAHTPSNPTPPTPRTPVMQQGQNSQRG
jgi:hypothetical protein